MDSYGFINNIQVEKTNALIKYKQLNNISKLFRAIEVFIAVALISWYSTRLPAVFKVSGEYIYACSCYVLNQHVVFLLGNVIVVVCYVLSGHTELGIESECFEVEEDDIRFVSTNCLKTNESVSNSEAKISDNIQSTLTNNHITESGFNIKPKVSKDIQLKLTNNHVTESGFNIEPEVYEDIQSRFTNNHITESKVFENKQSEYAAVDMRTDAESEAEVVIKKAMKRIERFNRTQSAKLSMEISMKPRSELRRSVTEKRRNMVAVDGTTSLVETVERLSNEEFRLAVEAFISEQQSLLKQQSK